MVQFSFISASESADLASDVEALFNDLAASLPHDRRVYSGECRPALDVRETASSIEVVMDTPGVPPEAIRVVYRAGVLLIAGAKVPSGGLDRPNYHLVERQFGRFVRVIRLTGAFDLARSTATLRNGELTIHLPTLPERRGTPYPIRVASVQGNG